MDFQITSTAQLVAKKLEDFGAEVPKISKGRIYGRMVSIHKQITRYPARWSGTLPKNWYRSEKQRRFVMALVRGGKVPYQRGGRYGSEWEIINRPDGYLLRGKTEKSKWVSGDAEGTQAKIHKGRWAVAANVIKQEVDGLPAEINQYIQVAAKERGL